MRLIDADAVRQKREDFAVTSNPEMNRFNRMFVDLFNREIDDAPTIDAKPVVRGHWIPHEWDSSTGKVHFNGCVCSECGNRKVDESNYCPNCGADMREVSNATD